MSRRTAAPVRTAVALLTTGLVGALAGCTATNPVTSDHETQIADGVSAAVTPVTMTDLLVVSAAKGAPGTLVGSFTNASDRPVQVAVSVSGAAGTDGVLTVPADGSVYLGTDDPDVGPLVLASVPAAPGALVTLQLSTAAGGSVTVPTPVLDGTLPQYATLLPTTTPTPTPGATTAG